MPWKEVSTKQLRKDHGVDTYKKRLRSDAALKRVLKMFRNGELMDVCYDEKDHPPDVLIYFRERGMIYQRLAEISLRDIISKRASLKGIEKRQRAALRAPKKNPKPTKRG